MSKVPYSNVVGSIMYLMVCTRPDLSYAMSMLRKYMSNPGKPHWNAMKWTLRYLLGTTDIGLTYRRQNYGLKLEGYSDAYYAGDKDQRRSTSAYYFLFGGNCISWRVQLQPVVALSTTEAIKETIWIHGLLSEINIKCGIPTVYTDSQSCIHLCKNPIFHDRTKHVEVKYHFIREKVTQEQVFIEKVPTEENPADMGTKVVTLHKFKLRLNLLGVDTGG
ncbi:secreted RxLR effector protein 161-like [Humulus lupulus]|uniref:secreted RxLR effector protein 161-like n=1 Tax=Humulus lupulus TaxID=3486 RepID=UPI002B401718|nr:secreted RxLR effector protein 161-like [Humulus lupulus]